MDAPSRSQVESENSSRMKAENEPREVGIAASVSWVLEDRGDILICGMQLELGLWCESQSGTKTVSGSVK